MTTDEPSGADLGRKRRRPGSTIDLTATEVASEPVATPGEAAPVAAQDAPSESPRVEASAPAEPDAAASPPPEPSQPDPASEPPPVEPEGRPRLAGWPHPEIPWPLVGAGALGAVIALLPLLLVFWLAGVFAPADNASLLQPRLAAVESQIRQLASRPVPPPGADPRSLDELKTRLDRVESAASAPRSAQTDPALFNRFNTTEGALKNVADQVAALGSRIDAAANAARDAQAKADNSAAALTDLQAKINSGGAGADRAVRLALIASALRTAVERGAPFTKELAAAKQLAENPAMLAPLEPFAASGVPDNAALGRELASVLPVMRTAIQPAARDGGFLDRLQANAERLVRVTPVDQPRGDDRSAVLARVERSVAQSDIDGALAELNKLPPDARTPAQAWMTKAEARVRALEAARRFAADAVAGLRTAP